MGKVGFGLLLFLVFLSCKKQDVLLPKSDFSSTTEITDYSPIYLFFKTNQNDTIAELNRKNSIISTNWIFHVDKRMSLKTVIPQVMKLQEKKRSEKAHKNENAENYYSYADSLHKNLAFLKFTRVFYKLKKPVKDTVEMHFLSKNKLQIILTDNGQNVFDFSKNKEAFLSYLKKTTQPICLSFDKKMYFEDYIQIKIELEKNKIFNEIAIAPVEYLY
ncbi:hypothetical protein [Flavobacterium agrisoli]|uniref:Lipoprotein n=1 Tax=Flavobacterium agrisoli TaxID=2793066 RepID=A0A934PK47_9FLAO|nr:hypothetical protein [Flavobacterium agrisoli]MBK0368829.1 hypothetical protein [Flavobacterium agrisoli]